MVFILATITLFLGVTFFSTVHALGLWLLLMITHGVVFDVVGESAKHVPLYSGVAITLVILVRRQWSGVSNGSLFLFGALLITMALASIQGVDLETSLVSIMLYAKVFLLALLLAGCLKSEKDIRVMTLYCLAGLLVGSLVAIYQYKTGTFAVLDIYTQRAAGLREDPNDTAMLLVAGVPLAIYWFLNTPNVLVKLFFAGAVPLLLVGIGLTGSRGGFVVLVVMGVVIYLRRPTLQLTLVGLIMVATVTMLAPQSYWERMESLTSGKEAHGARSLESRSMLLQKGMLLFSQRPVLGVGPGNYGNAYMGDVTSSGLMGRSGLSIESDRNIVAHNLYLELLVEIGVLGTGLFLSVIYRAIRGLVGYGRKTGEKRKAFELGFAIALALGGMLLAGLFLSQGKNSVLWFLIGLGFAAGQITAKAKSEALKREPMQEVVKRTADRSRFAAKDIV